MRTLNRNRNNEPISNEQIQKWAPSAFAQQAYEKQSDRYAFVPTSVVIDGMRQNGFLPVSAQQSRTRVEGKENFTKHMIRFRPANVSLVSVGDSAVEVILINSHDGTSRYDLSCGVFRLACLNGMMVSEGLVERIRIRHTGNIIEEVIQSTERIISQAPKVMEAIELWRGIQLTQPEQLILAEAAYDLRFEQPVGNLTPNDLLTARRREDVSNDLYTTFNRIQENTVRGGLRHTVVNPETNQSRRTRTREVKGIDQDSKLNRALWAIGEKMAALKS